MAWAGISENPIDTRAIEERVCGVANGGVCTFVGQVRDNSRGRDVAFLEYSAYAPMAEKQLRRIGEQAEAQWPCEVAIQHRIGRIGLGEASVVVSVGSPHRAEAFVACRWCIDTLKENVPIWKREVCPDGSYWIEGDNALPQDAPPPPLQREGSKGRDQGPEDGAESYSALSALHSALTGGE